VRPFSNTSFRLKEDEEEKDFTPPPSKLPTRGYFLEPQEEQAYELLSPEERAEADEYGRSLHALMTSPQVDADMSSDIASLLKDLEREAPSPSFNLSILPREKGYWAEGEEDDEDAQAPDMDEWKEDDMSSYAHGDLEQHREAREYSRLAAWELPLLSSMSKHRSLVSKCVI
jgi:small subunit ribosomal protein S35